MSKTPYQAPFALVVLGAGEERRPELAIVVFDGPAEAQEFAGRHGITDWLVTPVAFSVEMDRRLRERSTPPGDR